MGFQGGDIVEIAVKHDGNSYIWQPKSAEDFEVDNGGYTTNDDANGITGAGSPIYQKNRKRWKISGPIAWDMDGLNELQQAQNISNSPIEADFVVTHINGTVWGCRGTVVGDIVGNTNAATIALTLAGGGVIEPIG